LFTVGGGDRWKEFRFDRWHLQDLAATLLAS